MNHLVVSRILRDEVRSLRDLVYWVIGTSETTKTRIGNAGELREILLREFGIQVTEAESRLLYERAKLGHGTQTKPAGDQTVHV